MIVPDETKTFDETWRERFERYARTHEDEARISGWSQAGLQRRLDLFRSLLPALGLPPTATVLDLGCGAGTYVRLLAGLGHRAVGFDYSLPSLARALAMDPGRKGHYVAGEAYGLPFAGERFDLVVSIGVLQALGRPERALAEMARVLRPGGLIVVEALNGHGVPALARRGLERLRGLPPRVRAYPVRVVRGWIAARGLRTEREARLSMPPRRLPRLARLLDVPPVRKLLGRVPPLGALAAHSVLFVARKPVTPAGGRP